MARGLRRSPDVGLVPVGLERRSGVAGFGGCSHRRFHVRGPSVQHRISAGAAEPLALGPTPQRQCCDLDRPAPAVPRPPDRCPTSRCRRLRNAEQRLVADRGVPAVVVSALTTGVIDPPDLGQCGERPRVAACRGARTCAGFLTRAATFYAAHGITIARVLTDNATNYIGPATARPPSRRSAPGTPPSGHTARGRTARPSGSTAPSPPNGPTGRCSPATPNAPKPSTPGASTTTLDATSALGGRPPISRVSPT
jgi:hypothetical protein